MTLYGESILIINTILCFLINLFGYLIYKKSKNRTTLYIGIAFLLFGISNIISFLGLQEILNFPLLIIRFTAYFTIIAAISINKQQKISLKLIGLSTFITSLIFHFIPQILNLISIKLPIDTLLNMTNLILCLLIVFIALLKYRKQKDLLLYFIGIGFLLFSLSHILQIITINLGLLTDYSTLLAIFRILSYTLIMVGIYTLIEKETLDKIEKYTTNTKLQLSVVLIMIVSLVLLFYYPNKRFLSSDPKSVFNIIKPSYKSKQIIEIKTGIYIKNFTVFDIIKNEFVMNAIIWFEFNPHQINLNTIKKFSLEKGKILKKSKPKTKKIGNKLWVYYKIKAKFSTNLDYRLFPIEDHKIYIKLINSQMNPDSEILVSYNTDLTIKDKIFTGDWKNIGKEVEYGYIEHSFDKHKKEKITKYPIVLFELYFEKAGIRKTLAIFLPLFMVFFLSLFSLLINIKDSEVIFSLSAGSTTALIFSLIVIESMSPDVRYFTIANKIYTLLLIVSFVILLLNIYIAKEIEKETNEKKLILIRSYSFFFFIIFILITIYSMLY